MIHENGASSKLMELLHYMVENDGSDLYLTTGAPPSIKVHGNLVNLPFESLPPTKTRELAYEAMNEEQKEAFHQHQEMNLALSIKGVGRFRVNIFVQRGEIGLVIRNIKTKIPSLSELQIPDILQSLVMERRGLILMVGATGMGKSTSLASLIEHRNIHSSGHIITIEDPIEYIYRHKKSIVNQREVGVDTQSYEVALQNTLRQAPDLILIGEIRSQETMQHAIAFAETGHLCLSTLHANNANQALDRIVNFFPEERHNQLHLDLSLNLRGIISQRLIPTLDGKRVAAFEILLGTPLVQELIRRNKVAEIKEVMAKSENLGMQTFDTALYKLYMQGAISFEEAIRNADSQNNLRLRISLKEGVKDESGSNLSLKDDDDHHNPKML